MPVALSHETLGSGEPLIILHGLFGSKRNWTSIARPLAESAQVIAVDLRNHGESAHAPDMDYTQMAADLQALADRLGLEQLNVAGHSMGGKVAMQFALQYPERTRRLMVLDIAPVRYHTGFVRYAEAMLALPLDTLGTRQQADAALAPAIPDDATRQFLLHNLVRTDGRFRWRPNLEAIAASIDAIEGFPAPMPGVRFAGPACFLGGGRAQYLSAAHLPGIRALFPAAQLEILPQAGHWLHAEQPQEVLRALRDWLALPPMGD